MKEVNVLVVIDAQVDFESGSLGTEEAKASVPNIVKKIVECGNAGYSIFATKDTHGADYLDTNEGRHLPVPHTIAGTDGWNLVPAVHDALSMYDTVEVLKDTFGSRDLTSAIRAKAAYESGAVISSKGRSLNIVIIGWCTDICVIANAILLKTAFPEADITVDSSCCAGVTPQAHEAALTVMKSCQINVV